MQTLRKHGFDCSIGSLLQLSTGAEVDGGLDLADFLTKWSIDVPKFVSSLFQTEIFLHHCFHTPQGFHSVFCGSGSKIPAPVEDARILKVARRGIEPLFPG